MKKISLILIALCSWVLCAEAQITQEQANTIVKQYVQDQVGQPVELYIHKNAPHEDSVTITTSRGEMFKAKYACWAYFINETEQRRYLFVKASGIGSVLEVIASNDVSNSDDDWQLLKEEPTELYTLYPNTLYSNTLYPNPVSDLVNIPCTGSTLVEIYDLQGICVFSEQVFCEKQYQLSLSFLKSGVYMLHTGNQTHRIVKQ